MTMNNSFKDEKAFVRSLFVSVMLVALSAVTGLIFGALIISDISLAIVQVIVIGVIININKICDIQKRADLH